MKKVILTSLALLMTLLISTSAFAAGMKYGDINNSELVDANDALLVLKHAAKISVIEDEYLVVADVTGDGNIDAKDALDILKFAAKIIDVFEAETKVQPTAEATPEPTERPQLTPIPTLPMESVGPGTWPTMIPLPEVSADPANYVEGEAVTLDSLNGATEENGIYTFTDENTTNKKGIAFKNPFAGKKELVESFSKAFEGQTFELTDSQKIKYDPEATYPIPVWNTGVSLSFWAKYDWDSEYISDDEPILVIHRSKRDSNDFALSLCLNGTVRYEEGEDATNSFRGNGSVCGNCNEWNYYTITIKNDWITVYVNGQECAYQSVALTKGSIGLFNGGYMTKYNVVSEITEEQLTNDIRRYYRSIVSNGVVAQEAQIIDTAVYEAGGYNLGSRLLMDCIVNNDAEIVLGGTTTYKVVGNIGRADYGLKSGTQASGLKAYYTELTPEQVAANYAAEAEAFLK